MREMTPKIVIHSEFCARTKVRDAHRVSDYAIMVLP